jgi:glutamate---cysteine ligase / carboxylate-amine ligase
MIEDLKTIGHRNMLCGMHVHVQLPRAEKRFAVMQAMIPYLPLFIALSTSSPFWNSRESGLKGYRLAAYDELPRTGLPEAFESENQYTEYVDALQKSGVIPDESYIWWAMRSSSRHPTLELRAPDVCTILEDAIAIASLYRALARYLYERPALLQHLGVVERAIGREQMACATIWHRLCFCIQRRANRHPQHVVLVDRADFWGCLDLGVPRRGGKLQSHTSKRKLGRPSTCKFPRDKR